MPLEQTAIIGGGRKAGYNGQGKMNLVREKSVKSQGISFQTKSGHPDIAPNKCTRHKQVFYSSIIDCTNHKVTGDSIMVWVLSLTGGSALCP